MRTPWVFPIAFLVVLPQAVVAQEATSMRAELAGETPFRDAGSELASSGTAGTSVDVPWAGAPGLPSASLGPRGLELELLQEEIAPRLRVGLALYARVNIPGDSAVTLDNVAYSDIFDIGYGLNAELNLLSEITPHFSVGGYLSIGWDRFNGASNVDMNTGEFLSFDNQDLVTAIAGGKVLHRFGPSLYWEGRMGVGIVHYGSLGFTDVTTPIPVSGLQFFRPVNHGVFDIGGRVGFGNPRFTFDLGLDFRFMGSEAPGRDVNHVEVSPDFFFVFAIDLGVSMRF